MPYRAVNIGSLSGLFKSLICLVQMDNLYRQSSSTLSTTALMSSLLRFDPRRHLLVKLGVFQNLATHYDRSESGLRRKTVPLHRSEMSNQMSVDIKKREESSPLSSAPRRTANRPPDGSPSFEKPG